MNNKIDQPKVFISYSWQPVQNQNWVIEFAERLVSDGVDVVIDVWNLEEGQDKYKFMERMINDTHITKVLIICNDIYAQKANNRSGGVGSESMIISSEVYNNAEQNKFIPIIREYDEKGVPTLPKYIGSRIYIDLTNEHNYEQEYEKLLRRIFGKPSRSKPPLGNPPVYITEHNPIHLKTINKVDRIKNAFLNNQQNANVLIIDYLDVFLNSLDDYVVENIPNDLNFDDLVYEKIESSIILRDDFINFLEVYIKYSGNINIELLHNFFERFLTHTYFNDNLKKDCLKFLLWEIFLYCTTLFIKFEKFLELGYLLYTPYYSKYESNSFDHYFYLRFRPYVESMDIRNKRLQLRRLSIPADLIKKRAIKSNISFENLRQSDMLLYYISLFIENNNSEIWFPKLTVYWGANLEIFKRIKSRRFFDKVKVLFSVNNKEELINKFSIIEKDKQNTNLGYGFGNNIHKLNNAININEICTIS